MNNLKNLLTKPLLFPSKKIIIIALVLSIIAFAISTYLTAESFRGVIPPCSISGCEKVLSSDYSKLFGIPISLFGSIYYFIIALSLFLYLDFKKDIFLKIPMVLSIFGFLSSIFLISIMVFVLKAICIYCTVVDVISIIVFGLFVYLVYKNHEKSI